MSRMHARIRHMAMEKGPEAKHDNAAYGTFYDAIMTQ